MPRHSIRCDALLVLGQLVSPIWGPLADWLRDQRTVIEVHASSVIGDPDGLTARVRVLIAARPRRRG